MTVVGLTGGIASGKTTVSRMLAQRGLPVVDADALVHTLQSPGTAVWEAIRERFGWPVLRVDGSLNRRRLARMVFGRPEALNDLNRLVHPAVRQAIWQRVERFRQEQRAVVILDVPLLIEGGLYRDVDEVWLVYADPDQQLERLIARSGMTREAAIERMNSQMPLSDKKAFAHTILDNRAGLDALTAQVERAVERVSH